MLNVNVNVNAKELITLLKLKFFLYLCQLISETLDLSTYNSTMSKF